MQNSKALSITIFIVCFLSFITLPNPTFADAITITTYYPAPYGVYKEFETTDNTYLATGSGSVGIGTTTAGGKLTVHSPANSNALLAYESADVSLTHNLAIDSSGNASMILYADEASEEVRLHTAADSYFTGGNLGIGTTTPNGALGVDGEINFVPQDSAPSSNEGDLYYDSTTDEFKYYNGSIWQAVGGGGGPESWTCTARSQIHSTCAYDQLCIAEVSCQGDEKAISGGCEVPMGRWGGYSWMVNRPTGQGWRCVEAGGNSLQLKAWANCCE